MKRIAFVGLLGVALLAFPLVADVVRPVEAGGGTGVKIGVIDLERTLYDTPAGKRADEKFEKVRKKKQGELDKKQKELKKYAAELDKQATVLKPEVLKEKKAELEKKFVELQQLLVKLEKDLAGERTKLIESLLEQAGPYIEELAKSEGVDVIIDSSAVVWASKTIDLTDELHAKMK
jgi:outer membrane protein